MPFALLSKIESVKLYPLMSKETSLPLTYKEKAIVFRGGGLGDFILTLPLLAHIQNSYQKLFF